ncbi:MAG: HD domain-containing protein [Candidatus Roizmanbacteria bacterium]|nr:HD domain-containing protein [Candidatus Roizmanbacteria bacterium]
MDKKRLIKHTEAYVKNTLSGEGSGHDWWHIFRVWNTAKKFSKQEGGNLFIIELSALLHDIADRKFNEGDVKKGVEKVRIFLISLSLDKKDIDCICEIVKTCSFSSSFLEDGTRRVMSTLEGQIVQDADRLDAIGAIGIARAFAYGGYKNRELYNPNVKPILHATTESYTNKVSHSINHFYEKLLLLKDLMNTKTAKKLAIKRHRYMELFLKEFYGEWDGKL